MRFITQTTPPPGRIRPPLPRTSSIVGASAGAVVTFTRFQDSHVTGRQQWLSRRFAAVRVRAAQGDRLRQEEWLLIEWPEGEDRPTRYLLSNLPANTPSKDLVMTVKTRWRIERDYQDLKQEFGMDHYEGRGWRYFHHHATLCVAAYEYLVAERLRGAHQKTSECSEPILPQNDRPRGTSIAPSAT
ncbi:hypothetical protein EYC55_15905 [Xanthomonas oryzae]|nr:hypothetical protein EYC55_15905 [Xanthomonas oryzae]